jgi:quercetin 2,3-dioxygenase
MRLRDMQDSFTGRETFDGAGVRLRRMFSYREAQLFDPFLLLDSFGSQNADEYLAGFPWHPHRGIETVTYMLDGTVKHGDSLGNSGVIGPGDLQWMTAGSGIIHEEMPQLSPRGVRGLQLWVNLPAQDKMTAPRYRGVEAAEPPVVRGDGLSVRVISGEHGGRQGPLRDIVRQPTYLDVTLSAGTKIELPAPAGETTFAFVFDGSASLGAATPSPSGTCVLFGDGDAVAARAGDGGARFIFVHAQPLRESIAWGGPIVMNTQEELDLAFREYRDGTFIKAARGAS